MSQPFARTLRSLARDSGRPAAIGILLASGVALAWGAWFCCGRVTMWEVTDSARLEVTAAAHPVAAQVPGRVVRTELAIGREVYAGDVLIELDDSEQRIRLASARAKLADLHARAAATRHEIEARRRALDLRVASETVCVQESAARVKEADALARLADSEATMLENLYEKAIASEEEWNKAKAEASARRATVEALGLTGQRLERERSVERIDREAAIAELERDAVELDGQIALARVSVQLIENELALRSVRAPIAGRVGETRALEPGAVVSAGEVLGSIVPAGDAHAVAFFPVQTLGRIRPGQPAVLRLDGFSWSRFGTLRATVADVASEPVGQHIRVELSLVPGSAPAIPREHGLSGRVEVAVERITPADFLLRAVGELLFPATSITAGSGGSASRNQERGQ